MATPGIRIRPGAGSSPGPPLPPIAGRSVDQSAEDFLRDIRAARGGGTPDAGGLPWYRSLLQGVADELGLSGIAEPLSQGPTAGLEAPLGVLEPAGEGGPPGPTAQAIPRPPSSQLLAPERYGLRSAVAGTIGDIRRLAEAGSALLSAYTDPATRAALWGKPVTGQVLPMSIAQYIPSVPYSPEELQRIAAASPEPAAVRAIQSGISRFVQALGLSERWWEPSPKEEPTSLAGKVRSGLAAMPIQLARLLAVRRALPVPGRPDMAPAALDFLRTVGAMATLGVMEPAIRGQGPKAAAKGFAIGTGAGVAFGLVPFIPPAASIPTVFAIGAGQGALEGGTLEDAVANGATLAIAHILLKDRGRLAPRPGEAGYDVTAEGRVVAAPEALGARQQIALPGAEERALARGPIPMGPERAAEMGQRLIQLVKDGYDARQIASALQREGYEWHPKFDEVIYDAQSRLLGRRAAPPITAAPSAPPTPPGRIAIPQRAGGPIVGAQSDPALLRMQALAEVGFSPGQIVEAARNEGLRLPPDAHRAAEAIYRAVWSIPGSVSPLEGTPSTQPEATPPTPAPAPPAGLPSPPRVGPAPPSQTGAPPGPAQTGDIQQHPMFKPLVDTLSGETLGLKKGDAKAVAARVIQENPGADFDALVKAALSGLQAGRPEFKPPAPPSRTSAPGGAPPPFPSGAGAETTPVITTGPALPPQTAQAPPGTEISPGEAPGGPPITGAAKIGQTFEVTDGPDRGLVGKIIEILPHPTRGMEVPTYRIQVKKKVYAVPSNMGRLITKAPIAPTTATPPVPIGTIAGDNVAPPEGPRGSAFGPDAKPIPFVWRWLDPATDVITSHDTNLTPRPADIYPVDVQNRNRLTAESRVSYDRIRKNPIGERYAAGTELDTGAPWVVPWQSKLVVPVGNIRTLAYISAQSVAPDRWSEANQALRKEAVRLGIPQTEVDAKPNGALFRQPVDPVKDLVQFAISGNTGSTPTLSPSEQARTDAYLVPSEVFGGFEEGTETGIENALRASRNRVFVTDILSRVVQSGQLNTMVDPDGSFNRVAIRRVAGMMLDKAYAPSSDVLAMALEATHPEIGRVVTAFQNTAGRVLKADARIANEEVKSLSAEPIGRDLGAALSAFTSIRQAGITVDRFLNPPETSLPGMERGASLSPRPVALLRQLDSLGVRSESDIRNWIKSIVDPILTAPDERQVAMFLSAEGRRALDIETGHDADLADQLRSTFLPAQSADESIFILRDGSQVSLVLADGRGRVRSHSAAARILPGSPDIMDVLRRSGAVRSPNGDSAHILSVPTPLQVQAIVERARRLAKETGYKTLTLDFDWPGEADRFLWAAEIVDPTVEKVNKALGYARDLYLSNGWLDDGRGMGTSVAQFAIIRDPDGTVRAVPEFNVARAMDVMGENLYRGKIPSIVAKELIQNAVDSFIPERLTPAAPGGPPAQPSLFDRMHGRRQPGVAAAPRRPTISLVTNDEANTITVRDNGEGMLPEVAGTTFVDPFSSQKLSAASVGRFGIAKIAIIRNSESFDLITRARDASGKTVETRLTGSGDDYAAGRGLKMETREIPGGETGTTVKVKLKPEFSVNEHMMRYDLSALLTHSRLPVQINARIGGDTLRPERTEMAGIGADRSPGARIEFSVSRDFKPIGILNTAYPIRVLNNGMYQFDFHVFTMPGAVLPTETSVDISPTVEPEHGNYPFDLNRQGLRAGADEVVRKFVRDHLLPRATEMTNERYTRAWDNAPTIPGTDFKVVDVTEKVPPAELQILVEQPHLFRYVQAAKQAFDVIQPVLVEAWPEIGEARFGGIGIGAGFRAMVLRMKDVDPNLGFQVILNPYGILSAINRRAAERGVNLTEQQREAEFAQDTTFAIVHELTHPRSGAWSEGADFSAALTESGSRAIFVMPRAAQAIYSAVGGTNASTVEFVNDLTTFLRPIWTKDNVFGPLASQLGGGPGPALSPGAPGGGTAAGVGPRSPVFRSRGVRPEDFATGPALRPGASRRANAPADVLTILEPATIETRLSPPGPVGNAGEIIDGKLTGTHVTSDPERPLAALRSGAPLAITKQGGGLGGGLYFSGAPQLWRGRGRHFMYDTLNRLDPDARRRVVASITAESGHTFSPGYLTEPERETVRRWLAEYIQTGHAGLLALAADQPFNMSVEAGTKAAGISFRPPTEMPVEIQGKLLDYGGMTREQLASLDSAAEQWLEENGYVDKAGKPTMQGLAVVRRYGTHKDLFNEYLRALGYDGALMRGHLMQYPETVVWNSDAVRRFGDWRNPRPAPGVIGEGTFYPPRPGYMRLFRGEVQTPLGAKAQLPDWITTSPEMAGILDAQGRWFTDDPDRARWYARVRQGSGEQGRIVFTDVPRSVYEASRAANHPEARRFAGGDISHEWFLPREFADQKRVLWSRTADYARLHGHGEIQNPYDTSKLSNRDLLVNRQRLEAIWSRFDSGEIGLRDQVRQMQELRRGIAESIIRTNPGILGSVLTDGRDYISIHAGANPSEPARITTFSKDGPIGHTVYQTPQEALVEAIREGYVDPVPPQELDWLALTPGFQRGVDVASVVRFGNHLNYMDHPARSLYSRLPWEVQIRIATDPGEQERFLAGTVPDSIAMFAKDSSELLQPPSQRPKRPAPVQQQLFPSEAIPRSMPGEKLKPTVAQVPTDELLDELRPPLPPGPDLFADRPKPEQTETEGTELGAFMGVPRLTRAQRQALLRAFRQAFGREGEPETPEGRTARRQFGTLRRLQAGIAKRGAYSLEGYLHSLGSEPALNMEMALKNTWADYYRMAEKMWSTSLGPHEAATRPYLQNFYEVVRGTAEPANETVRRAYEGLLILAHPDTGFIPVNTRARDIRGYTGPGGRQGPLRPFTPRTVDLMPRIYPPGYIDDVLRHGTTAREEAAQHLVNSGQATDIADAMAKIDAQFRRPGDPFAPGITEARDLELPGHIRDPFAAWAVRIDQAAKRFAFHDNLGPRHVYAKGDPDSGRIGWLTKIEEEHGYLASQAARSLYDYAFAPYGDTDLVAKIIGGIQNYETATKLPLAFIQNLGQNSQAAVMVGLRPWLQTVAERSGILGPSGKARAREAARVTGVTFRQALRDLETQAGITANAPLAEIARKTLWIWRWSETDMNRTIAPRTAEIGLQTVDAQLRRGMQLNRATVDLLKKIGIDPEAAQQRGSLTPDEITRGMWGVLDDTQFVERPSAVPPLFDPRGPLGVFGPMIFQWKSYMLRYNRFLWQNIVQEMGEGNLKPMIRFMIMAPAIGEVVGALRAAIGRRDRKWIWEEDGAWDIGAHALKNLGEAYGMGILGGLMEALGYGALATVDWATGPALSQLRRVLMGTYEGFSRTVEAQDGTLSAQRALERWYRDVGRSVAGEVPIFGRPFKARAWTEEEQLNRMHRDEQQAMHKAAELRAQALQRTGRESTALERRAEQTLQDFNRKYRDVPGFIPVESVSRDSLREALRALQETEIERARRRMPKQLRPSTPSPMERFKRELGIGSDLSSMVPPELQQKTLAAAALVAGGPSPHFKGVMDRLEAEGEIPRPPVMDLASLIEAHAESAREEHLSMLPPDRQRQIRAMLALASSRPSV